MKFHFEAIDSGSESKGTSFDIQSNKTIIDFETDDLDDIIKQFENFVRGADFDLRNGSIIYVDERELI